MSCKIGGAQNNSAPFDLNLDLIEVFSWKTTPQIGLTLFLFSQFCSLLVPFCSLWGLFFVAPMLISSRFQWDWPSKPTLFSILFCAEYLLQLSVWWLYPAWINTQTYCFIKIFLFFIICLEHCRWLNTEIFTTNDTAGMPTCKQNDCVWNGIKCHHIWKVDLIRC